MGAKNVRNLSLQTSSTSPELPAVTETKESRASSFTTDRCTFLLQVPPFQREVRWSTGLDHCRCSGSRCQPRPFNRRRGRPYPAHRKTKRFIDTDACGRPQIPINRFLVTAHFSIRISPQISTLGEFSGFAKKREDKWACMAGAAPKAPPVEEEDEFEEFAEEVITPLY